MSNNLSQMLFGVLIFTACIAFFNSLVIDIGETYYATPRVSGLSELDTYDDVNTQVINPFMSQTQQAEMVGTGSYLPYAAIPQMLGAMRSFFNLPAVIINIVTTFAKYVPIPTWFFELITQAIMLTVVLGVAYAFLNREI